MGRNADAGPLRTNISAAAPVIGTTRPFGTLSNLLERLSKPPRQPFERLSVGRFQRQRHVPIGGEEQGQVDQDAADGRRFDISGHR